MDLNVAAFRLVQEATGEKPVRSNKQAASREGGLKGGRVRAMKLSAEKRAEIAQKASQARWSKANVA